MNLDALRNITYGMYIISTENNGKYAGCIVNTVMQITSDNPILSVSVNKNNYTNKMLRLSKRAGISILSEETNKDTIVKFGFNTSEIFDKFDKTQYELIDNVPIVYDNICGYIIGDVINIIDCETHDIFLIRVKDTVSVSDKIPMTYDYYHKNMKGSSPKNAPTYQKTVNDSNYDKYECIICGHIYDESTEKIKFVDLPDDWVCPTCGVGKDKFRKIN